MAGEHSTTSNKSGTKGARKSRTAGCNRRFGATRIPAMVPTSLPWFAIPRAKVVKKFHSHLPLTVPEQQGLLVTAW
eukprot:1439741-Rhodomonas_salina.1